MDESLSKIIRKRMEKIGEALAAVAEKTRQKPAKILVVSKSQPLEVIREAIEAGITSFGENYAEEASGKMDALGHIALDWQMIGHIQSRKAEMVARGGFSMIHSLDSIKLAVRLDKACKEAGKVQPVLLEINVSGEESKHGFTAWDESAWSELRPTLETLLQLESLRWCGLMTMPPYFEEPEQARPYFQRLRRLQEFLERGFPQVDWRTLSMGTSGDYLVAAEEGASIVRIGRAILGPRSAILEK